MLFKYVLFVESKRYIIYKKNCLFCQDWIYFDDWNKKMILMANKHDGSGLHSLTTTNDRAMDMKVFAPNLQTG